MTNLEISKLMNRPIPKLHKDCRDLETFMTTLSLAINIGIALGREQTHESYNQMFRGYNRISIQN